MNEVVWVAGGFNVLINTALKIVAEVGSSLR